MYYIVVDINALILPKIKKDEQTYLYNSHFLSLLSSVKESLNEKKCPVDFNKQIRFIVGLTPGQTNHQQFLKQLPKMELGEFKDIFNDVKSINFAESEKGLVLTPEIVRKIFPTVDASETLLITLDQVLAGNTELQSIKVIKLYHSGELDLDDRDKFNKKYEEDGFKEKKIVTMVDIDHTALLSDIVPYRMNNDLIAFFKENQIKNAFFISARANPYEELKKMLNIHSLTLETFNADKTKLMGGSEEDKKYVDKVEAAIKTAEKYKNSPYSHFRVANEYKKLGITIGFFKYSFTNFEKSGIRKIKYISKYITDNKPNVILFIDDDERELKPARKFVETLPPGYDTQLIVLQVHEAGEYCARIKNNLVEALFSYFSSGISHKRKSDGFFSQTTSSSSSSSSSSTSYIPQSSMQKR